MLMQGKSFRDSDDDLVSYGEDWWRVVGQIDENQREIRFEQQPNQIKQLLVNNSDKKKFTVRQQLPIVLFEPDDMFMIHAAPTARRNYVDNLLMKIDPTYRATLRRYERALVQRNNLLKKFNIYSDNLKDAVFVWDVALAENGSKIMEKRLQVIEAINQTLDHEYSRIADKKQSLNIAYLPSVESPVFDSTSIVSALTKRLKIDVERGVTTVGPHRDDFGFVLNKKSAKQTASRGEARTILLALKQIEINLIEHYTNQTPILLLDDVFSELDKRRQNQILNNKYHEAIQTILTSTENNFNNQATIVI